MTEFYEGQEVEVKASGHPMVAHGVKQWRKAKIVRQDHARLWVVQFPDGTGAVVDAEHIRPIEPVLASRYRIEQVPDDLEYWHVIDNDDNIVDLCVGRYEAERSCASFNTYALEKDAP